MLVLTPFPASTEQAFQYLKAKVSTDSALCCLNAIQKAGLNAQLLFSSQESVPPANGHTVSH